MFFLRFVPGLRALISYPAEVFRMNVLVFTVLTSIGHAIWDFVLAHLGLKYGAVTISEIERGTNYLYVITAIVIAYFVYKVVKVVKGKNK